MPVLETARLRLRAPTPSDLDAAAEMWSNPDVVRHIGGKPSTREEAWARLLRAHGLWAMLGYGYWAVEEKESGRFVGDVGFGDFRRAIDPPLDGIPEMGWVLDPWCHGRGYASEAVAAGLAWADARLGAPAYCCIIAPGNAASIRVAEKAGFEPAGTRAYKGDPTLLFTRKVPGHG